MVVDPRITYGWGVYLNAYGFELNALRAAIIAAGGAAQVATCALATNLPVPNPVKFLISALCAVAGVNLIGVREAVIAHGPFDHGSCYQLRLVPPRSQFNEVGSENCEDLY